MTNELLEKLTDFVVEHLFYTDRDEIKKYILLHELYGTLDYAIDNGKVVGICRWNIEPSGKVAHILDLAIDKDWRNKGLSRDFLIRGLHKWSKVKFLIFERIPRGDKRQRLLPIETILKRKIF